MNAAVYTSRIIILIMSTCIPSHQTYKRYLQHCVCETTRKPLVVGGKIGLIRIKYIIRDNRFFHTTRQRRRQRLFIYILYYIKCVYTDKSITTAYGPCQFSSVYILLVLYSVRERRAPKNGKPQSKTQRYGKTRSTTMRLPLSGRRFTTAAAVFCTPPKQPNRENNPSSTSLRDRHRYSVCRYLYLLVKSSVGFYYIILLLLLLCVGPVAAVTKGRTQDATVQSNKKE